MSESEDYSSTSESEESTPAVPVDHRQAGNEAFRAKDFALAFECYTQAIESTPDSAILLTNRAAAGIQLGKFVQAEKDCERAIELDPRCVKAYGRQAKSKWMRGELDEAVRLYEHARVLEPKNDEVKKEISTLEEMKKTRTALEQAFDAKSFDMARSFANQLLQHSPQARPFLVKKAHCNIHLAPEVAARDLRDLLREDESDVFVLALRGKALLYAGNTDMGMQHFRSCLAQDPDNAFAQKLFRLVRKFEKIKQEGNDAFKSRQWKVAEDKYTEVLALDPQNKRMNAVIFNNRAAARKELGRLNEAEADCSAAIAADENFVKAWTRRSRIMEELERWDDAVKDMERAVELDPSKEDELGTTKRRVKLAKRKNFYKILNVNRDAGDSEIKKAYRKAAMEWHPDKWQSAEEADREKAEAKFKEIGEAFAVLSDPQKRRRYDMGVLDGDTDCGGGGCHSEMDPFSMFGGMGGMGHGMHPGMGRRGGPFGGHGRDQFSFSF
eukprot:Hpha_TRINITY_DN15469_c4_g13::TRINITY_DN15469_c4_g13_i1::g.174595::m.174595/K09527/DNAJC7; DnaJ homolog subfamily C member 7